MNKTLISLAFVSLLAACGGGGSSSDRPTVLTGAAPTELLVIGNSITLSPPSAFHNWTGNWGMAASSRDTDFAHLTASALGIPVTPLNAQPLEVNSDNPVPSYAFSGTTAVVIELGDNGMPSRYAELMDSLKGAASITCLSTFWNFTDRDVLIKSICETHGGTYIYIGDIRGNAANRDKIDGPQFGDPFVQDHPHDWSMARISERIMGSHGTR